MPLQRRLPKVGFKSAKKKYTAQVRLGDLDSLTADTISLDVLKAANIVPAGVKTAKVIDAGSINRAVVLTGIRASEGAAKKIANAGGRIEV